MNKKHQNLFKRYSEGRSTEKEIRIVNSYFDKLQKPVINQDDNEETGERIWLKVEEVLLKKKRKQYYKIAASVAAVFLLGALLFTNTFDFKNENLLKVTAQFGEQKRVLLPDSSLVFLNSGSTIIYPEKFSNDFRNITLKGEAYFKVVHKEKHPFIVASNNFKVQVLGTQFLVTNYEKGIPSVTVVSGKVKVQDNKSSASKIIIKNQRITYDYNSGQLLQSNEIEASNYVAWTDGRVFFEHADIEQVLQTLERRFNVELVLNSPLYKCDTISGNFYGNNIEEVLKSIRFINDMNYKINNKTITITLKPCKN